MYLVFVNGHPQYHLERPLTSAMTALSHHTWSKPSNAAIIKCDSYDNLGTRIDIWEVTWNTQPLMRLNVGREADGLVYRTRYANQDHVGSATARHDLSSLSGDTWNAQAQTFPPAVAAWLIESRPERVALEIHFSERCELFAALSRRTVPALTIATSFGRYSLQQRDFSINVNMRYLVTPQQRAHMAVQYPLSDTPLQPGLMDEEKSTNGVSLLRSEHGFCGLNVRYQNLSTPLQVTLNPTLKLDPNGAWFHLTPNELRTLVSSGYAGPITVQGTVWQIQELRDLSSKLVTLSPQRPMVQQIRSGAAQRTTPHRSAALPTPPSATTSSTVPSSVANADATAAPPTQALSTMGVWFAHERARLRLNAAAEKAPDVAERLQSCGGQAWASGVNVHWEPDEAWRLRGPLRCAQEAELACLQVTGQTGHVRVYAWSRP